MLLELIVLLVAVLAGLLLRARWVLSSRLTVVTLAVLGFGLGAGLTGILGVPPPRIHDEFSYLLAADTFAAGRVTNPAPPAWPAFETFHVLVQPTHASKYPPAQGLALALGQRLTGHPIVGVWLSMALLGGALVWCLEAFVGRAWAGAIAALYLVRVATVDYIGFVGYWANSYWGGALAAAGGALVLGAAKRVTDGGKRGDVVCLGLGLTLLANARPLEGLFMAAPILLALAVGMTRAGDRRGRLRTLGIPLSLILAGAACAMAYYNWRVTGDPLRLPYAEHESQYASSPPLLLLDRRFPDYHAVQLAEFWQVDRMLWLDHLTFAGFGKLLSQKAALVWHFYLGVTWTLALLGLARCRKEGWASVALASIGSTLAIFALTSFAQVHYVAPATAPLVLLLALSAREWANRFGAALVLTALTGVALVGGAAGIAEASARSRDEGFPQHRARIAEELRARGGKHLVLVRYGEGHSPHLEWVFNEADLDAAPVVWARDIQLALTRAVIDAFPERSVWRLDSETDQLEPYLLPPALDLSAAVPADGAARK
jgi:hypothetical protein